MRDHMRFTKCWIGLNVLLLSVCKIHAWAGESDGSGASFNNVDFSQEWFLDESSSRECRAFLKIYLSSHEISVGYYNKKKVFSWENHLFGVSKYSYRTWITKKIENSVVVSYYGMRKKPRSEIEYQLAPSKTNLSYLERDRRGEVTRRCDYVLNQPETLKPPQECGLYINDSDAGIDRLVTSCKFESDGSGTRACRLETTPNRSAPPQLVHSFVVSGPDYPLLNLWTKYTISGLTRRVGVVYRSYYYEYPYGDRLRYNWGTYGYEMDEVIVNYRNEIELPRNTFNLKLLSAGNSETPFSIRCAAAL